MRFCSNCGREIHKFERKCPECGNPHNSLSNYFAIDDDFDEYFNNKYIEDNENINSKNKFKTIGKYKFPIQQNENKKFNYSIPSKNKKTLKDVKFKIIINIFCFILSIYFILFLIFGYK